MSASFAFLTNSSNLSAGATIRPSRSPYIISPGFITAPPQLMGILYSPSIPLNVLVTEALPVEKTGKFISLIALVSVLGPSTTIPAIPKVLAANATISPQQAILLSPILSITITEPLGACSIA